MSRVKLYWCRKLVTLNNDSITSAIMVKCMLIMKIVSCNVINLGIDSIYVLLAQQTFVTVTIDAISWKFKYELYLNKLHTFRLVAFNLGYLPGGDKEIITRSETTLLALEAAKRILIQGGLISIVVYVGHPGGRWYFWFSIFLKCIFVLLNVLILNYIWWIFQVSPASVKFEHVNLVDLDILK
jgi:hypothetical protein